MENKAETGYLYSLIEAIVILLMAGGTVFVFSADASVDVEYGWRYFCDFSNLKQFLFFSLAVAVMFALANNDYRRFSFTTATTIKSPTVHLLLLSIILLVLVLCIGVTINGARRWLILTIGPVSISFQPSELAKWAMVFFLVAYLDKSRERIRIYWKGFVPICLVAGVIVGLIITEDFGTAALISLLTFIILLAGGVSWRHLLTPLPFMAIAFSCAIVLSPNRLRRLIDFFNPNVTPYQVKQSLIAIGSGGIFGKGLGKGICKYGYLPQDTTDFIFSIIAEELGFFGVAAVIALFVSLIVLGIVVAARCRNRFGCLLAGAIVMTIGVQAAVNIGVATNTLPTTGIPLPFVSAGGTSLLLSAAAVGVLVNIAKQTGGTCGFPSLPDLQHRVIGRRDRMLTVRRWVSTAANSRRCGGSKLELVKPQDAYLPMEASLLLPFVLVVEGLVRVFYILSARYDSMVGREDIADFSRDIEFFGIYDLPCGGIPASKADAHRSSSPYISNT